MTLSPVLMPHAVCWAAAPRLIWTMVVANLFTFLAYVSLCVTLLFIGRRTHRVMARDWFWFVVGFAFFILACGTTHLMDVVTTWVPAFWVDAWSVVGTAILSAYVAVMLIRRAGPISLAINDYARRLASTEQEKLSMQEKLLAARKLEEWSRMSAAISHEISNPLESIQNVLYLIHTDPTANPEAVSLARQAEDEVRRVITISRSTLAFHRESARPEPVDLLEVAQSVRFLLEPLIRQREIDFRISGTGDLRVSAFPGETRQVVLNLARNACEAIATPGRTVSLHFAESGKGVELQVTDQGAGVDPGIVANLFDFGHSSKGDSGNGLGLWTVRQIVTKHGGRVTLDSSYREGARFVVWWPKDFGGTVVAGRSSSYAAVAQTA